MSFAESIFYDAFDTDHVYDEWNNAGISIEEFEPEVAKWWNNLTPEQKRIVYPFTLYDDGDFQYADIIPENDNSPEAETRRKMMEKHEKCDEYCYVDSEWGVQIDIGVNAGDGSYTYVKKNVYPRQKPVIIGEAKWWKDNRYSFIKRFGYKYIDLPPAFFRKFCHLEQAIRERIVEKYVCSRGYVLQPVPYRSEDDERCDCSDDSRRALPNWKDSSYNKDEVKKIMELGEHTKETHGKNYCICDNFFGDCERCNNADHAYNYQMQQYYCDNGERPTSKF